MTDTAQLRGKTGRRRRATYASEAYVRVLSCPDDEEIDAVIYDPYSCFDKKTFAGTLMDGSWPSGMVIVMHVGGGLKSFVVCNPESLGPCLRQCDGDGFMIEGGMVIVPRGSQTSPELEQSSHEF